MQCPIYSTTELRPGSKGELNESGGSKARHQSSIDGAQELIDRKRPLSTAAGADDEGAGQLGEQQRDAESEK